MTIIFEKLKTGVFRVQIGGLYIFIGLINLEIGYCGWGSLSFFVEDTPRPIHFYVKYNQRHKEYWIKTFGIFSADNG